MYTSTRAWLRYSTQATGPAPRLPTALATDRGKSVCMFTQIIVLTRALCDCFVPVKEGCAPRECELVCATNGLIHWWMG